MSSYPEEIKQFIVKNVAGTSSHNLTVAINATFGTDYKLSQIRAYMKNHKLRNGLTTRFEKGNVSYNKGKKGQCAKGCEKGWFKKGGVAINHKPIGSERIDSKNGYTLIKTAEPNKWRLKQHVIWEKHHGEIPKGYKIVFLDCDNTNINIDNLALLSNNELLIMNRHGLRHEDAKLTETGLLIAKVLNKKNALVKKQKESLM